jgi:hypothetical protein
MQAVSRRNPFYEPGVGKFIPGHPVPFPGSAQAIEKEEAFR